MSAGDPDPTNASLLPSGDHVGRPPGARFVQPLPSEFITATSKSPAAKLMACNAILLPSGDHTT